ncbi:MAG: ComEA family DNA-binding protein [Candidatus Planktophila sp.]|jgi:competence protein ComEA|nr:ComEA family DNA-binding protein [Candidatus Planktophila sp.]MBP7903562.1 ComEA family DNA-binding protein [Candidatus Planktophila sp.]
MENIRNWWSDLHYSNAQKRSLLIVAGLVLATSSFFILRTSSPSEAIAPPPLTLDVAAVDITIDVQGAVNRPGVYKLTIGSRVVDAIKAAGGVTKAGDPSDLNQARIIADGEQIYVYAKSSTSGSTTKSTVKVKPKGSGFVLVNRASAREFEALDGIGPVLASRIVSYRKANGPFATIEDLLQVPGIGTGTLSKFKSKLRV